MSERLRILAIDDEEDILALYRKVLSSKKEHLDSDSKIERLDTKLVEENSLEISDWSFDLVVHRQANEAIETIKKAIEESKPFAMAFIDVRMPPGPDGIFAAKSIRSLDPHINIMMMTGYSNIDPQEIAHQVPPVDKLFYIQKPIHVAEIWQFALALGSKWQTEKQLRELQSGLHTRIEEQTKDLAQTNEKLLTEIKERKQVEKRLRRKHQIQDVLNAILGDALKPYTITEMLDHILERIVSIHWLALESKGAIFLVEDKPDKLILKSCYSFPEELKTLCAQVPFDKCLCGQAAANKKLQFSNSIDNRHHIHYPGLPPHGHYCVPILSSGKVMGVLNLTVREGHCHNKEEADFLQAIANMLAGIIERKQAEEAVQKALTEVEQLKNRLQEENIYLQNEIKIEHNFEEIITQSNVLKESLHKIEQVASTSSTVLILGETGTGKELFARAIHNTSNRKDRPLVKINCAAIPLNLIESELFGHEKGAFTGAIARKIGRFELADGGTIFLDEIGDLPLELQIKLLRVLQEGEFERLGTSHTIKVDVRIIAATNRNLEKNVKTGDFRQDLYYRLNVFPIRVPPLRDRKDDISLLVTHFVRKYNAKLGKKIESIPLKVMDSLQAYHWPGNVRELENIIERSIVLTKGTTLELDEMFGHPSNLLDQSGYLPTLKENERSFICKILKESHWVIEGKYGAARRLGIPPSTLRSRMKKHGIKKDI
jgi:transcriptional regulator with GAF, ATPase, and Fis domain